MNIPKEALDLAFKGGWGKEKRQFYYWQMTTCDPTFWAALGKELKWDLTGMSGNHGNFSKNNLCVKCNAFRFYDLILQGKDTTDFWKELIS